MAGIYIHIPFCKQKCYYCDFHSVANFNLKIDVITSIIKEIELQKNYLSDEIIGTIYFGGGTPSILSDEEISSIISTVYLHFKVSKTPEITLEANPDDLTKEYLEKLIKTRVNRLSIGIQSFFDDDLKMMNRRHSSIQAIEAVSYAQKLGYKNISIDLIYGLPDMTLEKWQENLKKTFKLKIQHISAYHLTYEQNTYFNRLLNDKKIKPIEEELSIKQFELLIEEAENNGFIHYEISNFAKENYYSKHNTNYWKQKKYLGIGPGAHSYDIKSRSWNISNNRKYIEAIAKGNKPGSVETLSEVDRYNDYIMTSLRTMWGVDKEYIKGNFNNDILKYFIVNSQKHLKNNNLKEEESSLILTKKGKFISDSVISDLFFV